MHRGTFVRRLLLTGEVQAGRAAAISVPPTEEWQLQIKWLERDGARVAAGQRVVEFDSSALASGLEEKRLTALRARREEEQEAALVRVEVETRRFQRERCRIAVEKARIDADVPEELFSRRELQERLLKLEKADVELEKASAQLDAAEKAGGDRIAIKRIARMTAERDVRTAETAIASLTAGAPAAGVLEVADNPWEGRKLQAGDGVFPGWAVVTIPDPSSWRVEAALVDVDDGAVIPGMPAECTLDAYPDRSYRGSVASVSSIAQEPARGSQRRVFRVEVALDEPDPERLRAGMSVKVEVVAERRPDALLAPRSSLAVARGRAAAFLLGGRAVPVTLGPCSAQECVLVAGLDAGTRLGESPRGGR